ncbi:hypothetical protein MSPP1_000299 [Malassezia sp. CBS 17886]|nr:hypothetical protein MSPP1_000299 [Malassezia sp. CBS 17886]
MAGPGEDVSAGASAVAQPQGGVRVRIKCPSIPARVHAPTEDTFSAGASWTIADVKRRLTVAWPGHPAPAAMRCISGGRVVEDAIELAALVQGDEVLLHVVVRPDAWDDMTVDSVQDTHGGAGAGDTRTSVPSPAGPHSPRDDPLVASGYFRLAHGAPPPAAPKPRMPAPPAATASPTYPPAHALLLAVQERPADELFPIAQSLYITIQCYATYCARNLHCAQPGPLLVPLGDWGEADAALREPRLRAAAVDWVESELLRWTPLVHESRKAQQRAAHAELAQVVEARLVYLQRALLAVVRLHDIHRVQETTARSAPTDRRAPDAFAALHAMSRDDWIWAAWTLATMAFRVAFFLFMFGAGVPPHIWYALACLSAVYVAAQGYRRIALRAQERQQHAGADAAERPRAPESAPASEPVPAGERAVLALPRLPARVPAGSPLLVEYWVKRIAWLELADEEAHIGFAHVPLDAMRIHWVDCDWTRPEALPPRPPALSAPIQRLIALPLFLFLATLVPQLEESRSDAIALRNEAIRALAGKWQQLQERVPDVPLATPRILQHPYARALLAYDEGRRRRVGGGR